MTHGWKAMNHNKKNCDQKKGGLYVHTVKNNFIITVHWNVGKISDLILQFLVNTLIYVWDQTTKRNIVEYWN